MANVGVVDPGFWSGRRVLVTGHTGFKGAWLSLWLLELGARVVGVSRGLPTDPCLFTLARLHEDVECLEADVRDFAGIRRACERARPEIILHLAAQAIVRRAIAEPRETYEVNVLGTVNVLDAARGGDTVQAIVNVTSDKCYENREWEWAYREDDVKGGRDPYSSSKGAAELIASAFRRTYGLPLASARAGNVIGGGDWAADRLVPDTIRALLDGGSVALRNPGSLRPWQHVLNPLAGYLLLAQALAGRGAVAEGFNFGPAADDVAPVHEVVERLQELWPDHSAGWRDDSGDNPPEATTLRLDSSRARQRLGWRPPLDLDAGLRLTVDWHVAVRDGRDPREVTLEQIRSL